jgi:hypothetical protein
MTKNSFLILLEIRTHSNRTHLYINRMGDANRELLTLILYLMTTFSSIDCIDQSDKTYSIIFDRRTGTDMDNVNKILQVIFTQNINNVKFQSNSWF